MSPFERQQLFAALIFLIMTLFLAAQLPLAARWRRVLQIASIAGFVVGLVLAMREIVQWWFG